MNDIKPFKPMLADKAPAKIRFPVYASAKLDGIRAIIKDGVVLSRTLKPIPNEWVQKCLGHAMLSGLDGELTVGPANHTNVMQATTSGVMSRAGEPDFTFWAFDFWTNQSMPYGERHSIMRSAFSDGALDAYSTVKHLGQTVINDEAELNAFELVTLGHGFEGVMLRSPQGIYHYGRSTAKQGHLLKLKRFTDGEAVVIGAQELMHNTNEATVDALGYTKRSTHAAGMIPGDTLGALRAQDLETNEEFGLPSFTDKERAELWAMHKAGGLIGKIAKYKHFKPGAKDAPRHPVFKGFRDPIDIGEPQ